MPIYIGIIVVLFVAVCIVSFYLLALKQQMKSIEKELMNNRQKEYNKLISIQLFDKNLTAMARELNANLDYQKQLKREQEQQEKRTKQSISDIAHDLRTPLTVVKGNLQMLDKSDLLGGKDRNYIRICQQKADELKVMIDDFFELSVLESDMEPVELKRVNVTNLIMQFLIDNEILIKERGLVPEIELPEKTFWIQAEEQFVYRMFSNLLGNIVKYAKDTFRVALKEEGEYCLIEFANPVMDNSLFDVEHLFDRSYMGDSSRNRRGNGLGLYIVKLLAEKQGAFVSAKLQDRELIIQLSFNK